MGGPTPPFPHARRIQVVKYFLIIQTEYFCDTVGPPAGAANFGDYLVIPEGVDISAVKVEGCIASDYDGSAQLKIKVPTISKYEYLKTDKTS